MEIAKTRWRRKGFNRGSLPRYFTKWFDVGSTALLDESATSVVWVPVVACGGRAVAESFPFPITARKVSEAIDEWAVAATYAGGHHV